MPVTFTHPWLLLALAALPLLHLAAFFSRRSRASQLVEMAGPAVGAALARVRPGRLSQLAGGLGMTLLAIGTAGPRWGRDWGQSAAPGRDLVAVLDCSRSMYAEAPSRLERACEMLDTLAERLRHRGGHRLGLVVFAGSARLACPLTHDLDHFREAVSAIDVTVPDAALGEGTRIGAGIDAAVEAFSGRSRASRDVLLLSDGDDPARDGEYRAGIERARSGGVAVHVVAIGDPAEPHRIPAGSGWLTYGGQEVRTRLEEAPLHEIARRTGGRLIVAGLQNVDLAELYGSAAAQDLAEDSPDALPVLRQRHEYFLLPALVLVTLGLLLPPRGGRP